MAVPWGSYSRAGGQCIPGAAVVAASEGTAQAGDSDTDPCCGTGSAPPAPALCSPSARLSPAAGDGLSAHGRRTRRYNEPMRTSAFYFLPTTFSWQTRNSHYTAGERTRGESTAGNRRSRRKEPLAGHAVTPPESGTGTEPQHNHSPISPSHTGSPAPNLRRWDPSERGRAHGTGAPGAAPCPRLQLRALGLPPPAARAAARPAAGTAGTWPCSGSPSAGCGAAVGLTGRWWRGESRGLSPSWVGGTGQDSLCCQTPVTNYGSARSLTVTRARCCDSLWKRVSRCTPAGLGNALGAAEAGGNRAEVFCAGSSKAPRPQARHGRVPGPGAGGGGSSALQRPGPGALLGPAAAGLERPQLSPRSVCPAPARAALHGAGSCLRRPGHF